jgi:hypothetical protein
MRVLKRIFSNDVAGLDFILQLKPVTYHYDILKYRNHIGEGRTDSIITAEMVHTKESIRYSGFLAQEVENAAILSGYDFSGIHHPENETDTYTLSYAEFVVPLVKAVQELNSRVSELESIIATLIKTASSSSVRYDQMETELTTTLHK